MLSQVSTGNGQKPRCHLCIQAGTICTYPLYFKKPGPKTGSKRAQHNSVESRGGFLPMLLHRLPSDWLQMLDNHENLHAPPSITRMEL